MSCCKFRNLGRSLMPLAIVLTIACTPAAQPDNVSNVRDLATESGPPTIILDPVTLEAATDTPAAPILPTSSNELTSEATLPPTPVPVVTDPPVSDPTATSTAEPDQVGEPVVEDDTVVQFPAGSTGTLLEGSIAPNLVDVYRLTASANQQMTLSLTSNDPANTGFAIFAPGETIPMLYPNSGYVPTDWNGALPATGEYRIDVYTFNQPVDYSLLVEILPLGATGSNVQETHEINGYRFEIYAPNRAGFQFGPGRLMQGETLIAELNSVESISELSGSDINGNGTPDLLVYGYTGGAHCCFSLNIFDLGTTATNILSLQSDNCGAGEIDLNGDGVYEIATCDDSFAYRYCAYAGSPKVSVYYTFDGTQYRPAAPNDPALFANSIASNTERAGQSSNSDWDGTNKCNVLGLALDHLYTGSPTLAYQAVEQYYTGGDQPYFWADILRVINNSDMYRPVGDFPAVAFPDYYDVWSASYCDPDGFGLLLANVGGDPCQERIGEGSFYLESTDSGDSILELSERVQEPEGCRGDCNLDILAYDEQLQSEFVSGQLQFMREAGQPTAILRLSNSGEVVSGPWVLRGDLSWEQR